jgi:scyllo-inositol 2-dehydrogenase (NADP+)
MADPINVGLIGYGMAGRTFHAPIIQAVPDLRLMSVVERHGDLSRERYPWITVERDIEVLLRDSAIDLIVVATPNNSHFDVARQALMAGKHVVVEKPFTIASAEARELIELAHQKGRIISVHHNRRWDGDFLTLRQVIDAKLLGRLVEFESHFDRFRNQPRPDAWREDDCQGAGILYDIGPHLIDQAQVLFGLPHMITADIRTQRDFAKTDDNFELILHYNNLKVTLKAGMLVREQSPRFILHGTEGSFVKYGFDPQEAALKSGLTPQTPSWGKEQQQKWGSLITGANLENRIETIAGCYQVFYQNIADAINGRAALAVTPESALNTIRIIECARESNRQQRTIQFSI